MDENKLHGKMAEFEALWPILVVALFVFMVDRLIRLTVRLGQCCRSEYGRGHKSEAESETGREVVYNRQNEAIQLAIEEEAGFVRLVAAAVEDVE